jgi:hypothetical protein
MSTSNTLFDSLLDKLTSYKKKYYTNSLLKGIMLYAALILSLYICINFLEYFGNFNTFFRFSLFLFFLVITLWFLIKWLIRPVLKLLSIDKQLSDEEAAIQIGNYFPEISDKLLNALQLKNFSHGQDESLIKASIIQKTQNISLFPFVNAINYKENKKYGKYLIFPFLIIIIVLVYIPALFVESTTRIINYDRHYAKPAPFEFVLTNKSLSAFKNEDYKLTLDIKGHSIPESAYLIVNSKRSKMYREDAGRFSYIFRNIQESETFNFEAAGFLSSEFTLSVISRPALVNFNAALNYPSYINKKDESLKNVGNLIVPEGTSVTWNFTTTNTDIVQLVFETAETSITGKGQQFSYEKKLKNSQHYSVRLENKESSNAENISYYIDVIPDEYPIINVHEFQDSNTYNNISFAGALQDDYGLTKLKLHYRKTSIAGKEGPLNSIVIPLDSKLPGQNIFYRWPLDSIRLFPGEFVSYYMEVWDNDGVNGNKSSKSKSSIFRMPLSEEIKTEIEAEAKQNEDAMKNILSRSNELKKTLEKAEEKLKNKTSLSWQDKKAVEDVLKEHKNLKNEIEQLVNEQERVNKKNEKFNENSPELAYKIDQLQKLMNELLDEETKKLYSELEKLLNENLNKQDMEKLLQQLEKKDQTLAKELERTLEMFKQLKFDQKLEESVKDLKKLSEKQGKLAEEALQKNEKNELLDTTQEKLKEDFAKMQEDLKELSELNKELENKNDLKDFKEEGAQIKEDQQKSSEHLKNDKNKKASESMKEASKKMGELADKLADAQAGMEKEQKQENLDDLRNILENLITLSFDQEALMKDFRKVNQSDPRFIALAQKQLKLKEDSHIIEDSLLSLAKRVFQIESFVTREVSNMKGYMDESSEFIKNRRPEIASGKQQFAMTSINNLALLLNDVLKQLQQDLANSMKGEGKMCNKPDKKKGGKNPGLGDMQKQLNERIQDLKKSGKTGRALSEELAKLAAQQEMIRKALRELDKKGNQAPEKNGSGNDLDKLSQEMQRTESDLVNKNLSTETVLRQKEILTRLLEAEKAAKERELDNKREAISAEDRNNVFPPSFNKYIKEKEKQVDLLKTISPQFTPYFKQEVNDYFHRIEK